MLILIIAIRSVVGKDTTGHQKPPIWFQLCHQLTAWPWAHNTHPWNIGPLSVIKWGLELSNLYSVLVVRAQVWDVMSGQPGKLLASHPQWTREVNFIGPGSFALDEGDKTRLWSWSKKETGQPKSFLWDFHIWHLPLSTWVDNPRGGGESWRKRILGVHFSGFLSAGDGAFLSLFLLFPALSPL